MTLRGYRPQRGGPILPVASSGPEPRRAPPPLPNVRIRAANGAELDVAIGVAVSLLVTGGAELITEPDPDTRAALDAAIDRYRQIPAVRRSLDPDV